MLKGRSLLLISILSLISFSNASGRVVTERTANTNIRQPINAAQRTADLQTIQKISNKAKNKSKTISKGGQAVSGNRCLGNPPSQPILVHTLGFLQALGEEGEMALQKLFCGLLPAYWQKWTLPIEAEGLPPGAPTTYSYTSDLARCIPQEHVTQCNAWKQNWPTNNESEVLRSLVALDVSCSEASCHCRNQEECRQRNLHLLKQLDERLFDARQRMLKIKKIKKL